MVQGYSISSPGEIFQELLCRLSIYSNMLKYLEFFIYFYQSVNIYSPWPYSAKSIVKQLTQLFSHMFIQALLTIGVLELLASEATCIEFFL